MRTVMISGALALALFGPAFAEEPGALQASLDGIAGAAGFQGQILVGNADATLAQVVRGAADRGGDGRAARPHVAGEIWPWASVTKQVTAAIVMQDVHAGRLSLDTRIAQTLPGFSGTTGNEITIRALLQHVSGLPNPENGPKDTATGMPALLMRTTAPRRQAEDALGFCAGAPEAAPGARFDYNNCGTIVVGAILETLHGKAFGEIVRERITKPIGARSVHVAPRTRTARRDVTGYVGGKEAPALNEANFGAGGALFGSAADLLRFDQALMSGKLMADASRATMWTGDPRIGYVALGAWSFPATLKGCDGTVDLIERRGAIGGVQVRNVMAPWLGRALVAFTNDGDFEFGEIWQGKGFSFDAVSAAFCAG